MAKQCKDCRFVRYQLRGGKSLRTAWLISLINFQGAEHTVLNGDLHSETHLWEAPGGNPKIQERAVNIESEYDYGSRSGVWRLFRLFNKYNYK
jgi:hypothetical protein